MSFVGYVLTYREGSAPERRRNLATVLAWIATLPEVTALVIEQDSVPRLDPADFPQARIAFHYNPGPFNKAWGLNVGARFMNTPVFAFGDADVIAPHTWHETVQHLRGQFAIAKPYRDLVDLNAEESRVVASGQFHWLPNLNDPQRLNRVRQGEQLVYAGGLFLIRREAFFKVGGFDERFVGWGGEDDAMTLRLQAGGDPMGGVAGAPALHLWHPRDTAGGASHPNYQDNLRILADYRRYGAAQYQRLFEVQRQILGDGDKYRPDRRLAGRDGMA